MVSSLKLLRWKEPRQKWKKKGVNNRNESSRRFRKGKYKCVFPQHNENLLKENGAPGKLAYFCSQT